MKMSTAAVTGPEMSTGYWRQEDRDQEQDADDHRRQARLSAFRDTGAAFDVAGVRTDTECASHGCAHRVRQQQLADLGNVAFLINQAGLLNDGGRRAHRVKEVGQHECEDRQ